MNIVPKRHKKVKVTIISSGEAVIYDSQKETAQHLGCSTPLINQCIKSGWTVLGKYKVANV